MAQRVVLVGFPGAQTLDLAGPGEVFAAATRSRRRPLYTVIVASSDGGPIRTTCGFEVMTTPLRKVRPSPSDTVLVSGGDEDAIVCAVGDERLIQWLQRAARIVRRIGSVCSGTFVLARAGLLDGKRVATHWSACERLARYSPAAEVDREAIFVRDGSLWTSAGVTTGIDMALAMVDEDHERALADQIAARLVLYARRPGFQSQFSDALLAQAEAGDPLGDVITRARAHLRSLDVPRLARLAGLSARTLHRRCQEQLRTTPAKLVERLRVEHARTLLSTTTRSLKSIAWECGFASGERMHRAFQRELGVRPADVRLHFGARSDGTPAP